MSASNAVPGFLPSTGGLHFANRFPPGPTVRFGPLALPRPFGIGDASAGLCGGMAWFVRERFEAGLPMLSDRVAPPGGSALFEALVRRQVKSLDWFRTPVAFWTVAAFGAGRAAQRTRGTEWPRVRATIDSGRLAMVGLVRHQGPNPIQLKQNHQVLAYAYLIEGDTVRLRIYDPNWPDRDDVDVVLGPGVTRQSTGEALFGIVALA
jgi:hypothetical protein